MIIGMWVHGALVPGLSGERAVRVIHLRVPFLPSLLLAVGICLHQGTASCWLSKVGSSPWLLLPEKQLVWYLHHTGKTPVPFPKTGKEVPLSVPRAAAGCVYPLDKELPEIVCLCFCVIRLSPAFCDCTCSAFL